MPETTTIGLLCNSRSLGGLELNTLRQAVWLTKSGYSVVLLAPRKSPIAAKAQKEGVQVAFFETYTRYAGPLGLIKAYRLVKAYQIGTLFIAKSKDISLAAGLKLLFNGRLKVIYIQHMDLGRKRDPIHTLMYSLLDAWVAPLAGKKHEVMNHTYLPERKIHVIPFGIELEKFEGAGQKKEAARQQLHLPTHATIIGIVGRLDPHKGQAYLLRAFAKLLGTDPESPLSPPLPKEVSEGLHLLIVGEATLNEPGGYPGYLRALSHVLSIEKRVHFSPFTDSPEMAYAAMDIFVMASDHETFGMVTIEAMAAGLAVVGVKTGGTAEIIQSGETGLFCSPRDPQSMAAAISTLIQDKPLAERLGRAAALYARRESDYRLQIARTERLLAQLNNQAFMVGGAIAYEDPREIVRIGQG